VGLSIKKDDTVIVVTGAEKGKKGRVIDVHTDTQRLVIEGINIIKKHMKPSNKYKQGGIIEKEAPIHRSNLMLVCPKCDKPTRLGHSILEDGKKIRRCKKCGEVTE
jgi:large subunit ribosomal protein L24